jgi:hypothetical protein
VEEGTGDDELLLERSRIHELKEQFLKHEMMIVDLQVILSLATRGSNFRLVSWKEGRGLYDSVTVADHEGMNKMPFRRMLFSLSRIQTGSQERTKLIFSSRLTARRRHRRGSATRFGRTGTTSSKDCTGRNAASEISECSL